MPDIDVQRWLALEGRSFTMQSETGSVAAVVLTSCTVESVQSFTLDFQGGTDAPAEQATYLLTAEGEPDPVPVFLVPSRSTADGVTYHAVFTSLGER